MLSSMLGLSERTINTYLKEIAGFCESEGITYVSRRGIVVCLELTPKNEKQLSNCLGQKTLYYDERERCHYICHILLAGWENYSAAMFAEELYVSRQTIAADLERAKRWLLHYDVFLNKKSRSGMYLTGTEAARRSALAALFRQEQPEIHDSDNDNDYRLTGHNLSYLAQESQKSLVKAICRGLQLFEAKTHLVFVDYSFVMMVEYLLVQRKRMDAGILIQKEELEPIWEEDERLNALADSLEFTGQIRYPVGERMYMGLLLCGAEFQREEFWQPQNRAAIGQASELCHYIVSYLSGATGLSFYGDQLLAEALRKCIRDYRLNG